jgi:hypothetical protein
MNMMTIAVQQLTNIRNVKSSPLPEAGGTFPKNTVMAKAG